MEGEEHEIYRELVWSGKAVERTDIPREAKFTQGETLFDLICTNFVERDMIEGTQKNLLEKEFVI